MHKISLKDWVILLTIVPTTLIGFGIASYFSYSRYTELDDYLNLRAQSIIEPIAIAGTAPILNKDRETLRQLIGFAHRSQSGIIKSIAVFTQDNQLFVTSAYHGDTNLLRLKAGSPALQHTEKVELDDYIIFRTPILDEHNLTNRQTNTNIQRNNQIDDYSSPFDKNYTPKMLGYIAIQIDKQKVKFTQQSQILVAFSIALLGSLLSSLFALQLIKNITRPVKSMVRAVERIREGKIESRVSGHLIGELNYLKVGINAMAQSLGDYQNEMQRSIDQATIDLRESLEQFEMQNVELSIAKRKAQAANTVKSEFLANMSHELRTPLNGVLGFTRQVLKTPLSDTQRDYLQTIERSANNLLTIINDILDFSKLDAGKMVIENIPFTLRDSLEETLALLAPAAHNKNIELSINIASHLPNSLIGDAMRIKQVMNNLVSNALKFTENGSISIDVSSDLLAEKKTLFKVSVTDTGIGMTEEQQQTIFEAFGQADKSITRLYGGTGLGLVISQRLAHEMNGEIGFVSHQQQGSTFWFTFQCEVNPLPLISELDTRYLAGKRILYYEPQTHSRNATHEILTRWCMDVVTVSTLRELTYELSHYSNENPFNYALIGHDHTVTALTELRKIISEVKQHISAVHLAINSNSPSLQEALLACGAISCMSKPVTATRLNRALHPAFIRNQKAILDSTRKRIPIKVLAVDDNEANLKLINALLLEQVTEVTLATNGQEALELCNNEVFALIFMDIQMPVMDGISTLKAIKANTINDATPIVAVTAHALSGEKEKLHQKGFNAYMTKPIDETMLSHIIYEYCDLERFIDSPLAKLKTIAATLPSKASPQKNSIIDWPLALKRTGNRTDLAKEMLAGLLKSLPETKNAIEEAITAQDVEQLKSLIHKLNGACCYTGVPHLARISMQLETELKQEKGLDRLEPEFLEFFEHIEQILNEAPQVLKKMV